LLAAGYESDEEDALVLAAEAAAALVAEDGVGISVSGVVVDGASLEDVVARVGGGGEAATTRGGGDDAGTTATGGGADAVVPTTTAGTRWAVRLTSGVPVPASARLVAAITSLTRIARP
jgi:hypothetical protein